MATYDLTMEIPKVRTGDILNCPYNGNPVEITLPKGAYTLECWGAQGGTRSYAGGKGGYSVGTLSITEKTTLYLRAGGAGGASAVTAGWNGGGSGIRNGCGGGGGSDIRIGQDSLYSRVIVAGGGGGGGVAANAAGYGCGGGLNGQMGYSTSNRCGLGGTQTAGGTTWNNPASSTVGTFGQGGAAYNYSCGGGGGGWYGGGGAYDNDSDSDGRNGGGGSGYVFTGDSAVNYPEGCLLNEGYYLTDVRLVAGNESFVDYDGTTVTGHAGDGAVRITVIDARSLVFYTMANGSWVETTPSVKHNGQIAEVSEAYVKVNGVWKQISS